MKYSIVIPTYNNKVMLNNALEAFNNQNGFEKGDYQIIVVDDGSDDDSFAYISDTPKNYEMQFIYLERTSSSSRAATRNKGWQAAKGQFIVFLDADIIVKPDYLYQLNRCFTLDPDILVIANRFMLQKSVSFEEVTLGQLFKEISYAFELLENRHFLYSEISYNSSSFENPWMNVYSCNMALSKAWLEMTGGFHEGFKGWGSEDTELGYRCFQHGLKIIINKDMEVFHQYHGEVHGTPFSKVKLFQWIDNINHMFHLHKKLNQVSRCAFLYAIFIRTNDFELIRGKKRRGIVYRLELKELDQLASMKETVQRLSSEAGNEIIIHDYLLHTDFDIWVQLLMKTKSIIQYYPISHILNEQAAAKFLKKIRRPQPVINTLFGILLYFYSLFVFYKPIQNERRY